MMKSYVRLGLWFWSWKATLFLISFFESSQRSDGSNSIDTDCGCEGDDSEVRTCSSNCCPRWHIEINGTWVEQNDRSLTFSSHGSFAHSLFYKIFIFVFIKTWIFWRPLFQVVHFVGKASKAPVEDVSVSLSAILVTLTLICVAWKMVKSSRKKTLRPGPRKSASICHVVQD